MSKLKDFLIKKLTFFLNNSGKEFRDMTPEEFILCLKFPEKHYHYMLPDNKDTRKEFLTELSNIVGVDLKEDKKDKPVNYMSPVVFTNRQAIGDILMFTCAIRDFKKKFPDWPVNIQSTAKHIWDNNPYLNRTLNSSNARIVPVGPSYLTNKSNSDDRHFANAFRVSIQDKLSIEFDQDGIYPDIWLSEEEILENPVIERPYWIITAGEKGDWTAKTYPFTWWQEVVNAFTNIKFVQIGSEAHKHKVLKGDNIVNYIGKTDDGDTGIRDLFKLFYHAEGSIGLVSFQMHLAAAFNLPCVVIAGAREPARFTRYPGHQYLCTDGCLPCAETKACWACNMDKKCRGNIVTISDGTKIPRCIDLIRPEQVITAIQQYYDGGRLSFDRPREQFMYNPPVKPNKYLEKAYRYKKDVGEFGMKWGGKFITKGDYSFILNVIKKDNIKSILDIGCGIHTILLADHVDKIQVLEADKSKLKDIKQYFKNNIQVIEWDKKDINLDKYDLVFIDGPPGGANREISFQLAIKYSDNIIVHDETRNWEREFQNKYLSEGYKLMAQGGSRCAYWKKRSTVEIDDNKKSILVMFNGRGDGGAEHSVTYICNQLIKRGYNVDYFTPNDSPCGTFKRDGDYEVNVIKGNYDAITGKKYHRLLLYANDWVWDFNKPSLEKNIPLIYADKKIMAVNFRVGQIGNIEWTKHWDKYIFLNPSIEKIVLDRSPNENTIILAPPLIPDKFLNADINNEVNNLVIMRHSSQGDAKYPKDFDKKLDRIFEEFPDSEIHLMPKPSFLDESKYNGKVKVYKRNEIPVWEFLSKGNCFWYTVPNGYKDMGPKVIMEAQLVGLPVIAEKNTGGADYRVQKEFLYDQEDLNGMIEIFKMIKDNEFRNSISNDIKLLAKLAYNPENWIEEILD